MKNLTTKILLLVILVSGTVYVVVKMNKRSYNSNNYFASIIDKDSLIVNTPSPRVIIGGASNAAFGIDSELMENELGVPVINMGIHGNFGLDFILKQISDNVRSGDIVILTIEYYLDELYYKDIDYVVKIYPKADQYVNKNGQYYTQGAKYFVSEAQLSMQKAFNRIFDRMNFKEGKVFVTDEVHSYDTLIYSRKAFNGNGDVVSHLDKKYPTDIRGRTPIEAKDYSSAIGRLNEFARTCKEKGAEVFFTYASYPESEFVKNAEGIGEFDRQIREELEFEILTTPQELSFPDSLFFDTVYHLNKEGRELRTRDLINKLKLRNLIEDTP